MKQTNRHRKLLIFFLLLFSCETEKAYRGSWVAIEEPFNGMSMEIKVNGAVIFSNIPVIKQNVFIDSEKIVFIASGEPIFDAMYKEGYFSKNTLLISLQNNGNMEKHQIVFADGRTLELLLESGYKIFFKKQ